MQGAGDHRYFYVHPTGHWLKFLSLRKHTKSSGVQGAGCTIDHRHVSIQLSLSSINLIWIIFMANYENDDFPQRIDCILWHFHVQLMKYPKKSNRATMNIINLKPTPVASRPKAERAHRDLNTLATGFTPWWKDLHPDGRIHTLMEGFTPWWKDLHPDARIYTLIGWRATAKRTTMWHP